MTAPDLTEARDLAAMWQARAEAAEAALDVARADARGWREECDGLMSSLETIAWDRDEARAIIHGRDVAPTSEELASHDRGAPMSGWWLCVMRGRPSLMRHDAVIGHRNGVTIGWWGANEARWWPLDAAGRPCAWPVAP